MVNNVEYLYLIYRTAIIFLVIMIIIRILGKREVGELSIFDLVIILIIANVGSIGIENEELFSHALLGLVCIFLIQKLVTLLFLKFSKLRYLSDGEPRILIMNGKMNYEAMKKEKYTIDDLICQMRNNQIIDIEEIDLAILETSGELSCFKKKDINKIVLPIIISGNYNKDSLNNLKLTKDYINKVLINNKINLKEILYCQSDGYSISLYLRKKNSKEVEDPLKLYLKQ